MTQVNDDEVTSENIQAVEVDVILDKTKIISAENTTMDTTVVLPNGIYKHAPVTPKNVVSIFTLVFIYVSMLI